MAAAARPWSAPESVSRVPGMPAAAVGPDGRAALAWNARNTAYGAQRVSRRGFGAPFALRKQRNAVGASVVRFDAAGNALFAHRRYLQGAHRMESATLRPSGSRTSPITLSGPGSSAYDPTFAAVAPDAFAPRPMLTWWRREPGRVQLATAVGGRLLVAENDRLPDNSSARYALGEEGSLYAVSAVAGAVVLSVRAPGGAFSTAVPVAAGPGPFRQPDIAIGPGGTLGIAWREYDGRTYRARAVVGRPGAFGAVATLSGADDRAVSPRIVITSEGAVRVAFVSTAPGNDRGQRGYGPLKLATLAGARQTLATAAGAARTFALGADGRGGAALVWQRREAGHVDGAVIARSVRLSGRLAQRQTLTAPGERGLGLSLAVGPRGDALAAWTTAGRLRAAHRPG